MPHVTAVACFHVQPLSLIETGSLLENMTNRRFSSRLHGGILLLALAGLLLANWQTASGQIFGRKKNTANKRATYHQMQRQQSVARPLRAVVPGTGIIIDEVGDDFEQDEWKYFPNHPKSSRNIDKQERVPLGQSLNGRWLEGPHRGTPDVLKRVPTPADGLFDSQYSLLIRTKMPGVPGQRSREPQQDDIMLKVQRRLGRSIPPTLNPNCVVRVFVPPFDDWENRTGSSFGFRMDMWGTKPGQRKKKEEQYWPGLFINFRSEGTGRVSRDAAFVTVRADSRGRDIRGPEVTPGWWTLGMSVSGDGMCHFYARKGVEDLGPEDHLGSYFCYGYRCQHFDLFFFNVVAFDNGQSWSTPWIIDDPTLYCRRELAANPKKRRRR
jgi:hypothetical protein